MYFSSHYFVLVACIFAFALNVLATDKGITFDGIQNFVSYSSLTTYDEDPQFTDAELTYLAAEAFAEMVSVHNSNPVLTSKRKRESLKPNVMTALYVGKEIYYSSSLKGLPWGWFYSPTGGANQIVQNALRACTITEEKHANGGSCGDVMSVQLFYTNHPSDTLNGQTVKLVTVEPDKENPGTPGNVKVKPPCGTPTEKDSAPRWGCNRFLGQFGIVGISDNSFSQRNPEVSFNPSHIDIASVVAASCAVTS